MAGFRFDFTLNIDRILVIRTSLRFYIARGRLFVRSGHGFCYQAVVVRLFFYFFADQLAKEQVSRQKHESTTLTFD